MKNITLIGMPSVGKSTVGVVVAKITGRKFVDTDLVIQEKYGLLPSLITSLGAEKFIALENEVVSSLNFDNSVIATGGNVVYGKEAMEHLRAISTVVYLRAPVSELEKRIEPFEVRGVVTTGATTVSELYDERKDLYEKYADIVVDENGSLSDTISAVIKAVKCAEF